MNREVIIACDFQNKETTFEFLEKLKDEKPYLKIGMELYYREGAGLVRELKAKGFKIFLDLKLHDIPNTVYKAMKNIASLGVDITNVHAGGGIEMMRMAKKGLDEGAVGNKPLLIAVTQLTSTSAEVLKNELLIEKSLEQTVKIYAENAKKAGLDGVVCSPLEAPIIKALGLISVTPGIRLAGDSANDQKRISTPALAKELGSNFIVVGRSITAAENPLEAYRKCVAEFC
ncbi:MAG: orotidine-5'-phosphate decarboxylase [Clostridia bacterium]|nr:orotidine-5'-phosphate decarboxylase [Clostridia bacterium]